MAQYEEITIDQGSDAAIDIHLLNRDKSIKDLTGFNANAQIRRTYNTSDSDAIVFTAIVALPPTDGIVSLSLTNSQTDNIRPGRYYFDAEISFEDSDGATIIERVLEGTIDITPSVTRGTI